MGREPLGVERAPSIFDAVYDYYAAIIRFLNVAVGCGIDKVSGTNGTS
jgi:hypothetical protein